MFSGNQPIDLTTYIRIHNKTEVVNINNINWEYGFWDLDTKLSLSTNWSTSWSLGYSNSVTVILIPGPKQWGTYMLYYI